MDDIIYREFHNQIAQLTRLAAAQIQVSVKEATDSVDDLTESFTNIVQQDRALRSLVEQLPAEEGIKPLKDAIQVQSDGLGKNVRDSIIAFQFFDRLCQRLEHCISCLRDLSHLEQSDFEKHIEDISRLKEVIYQNYSMEEERILFNAAKDADNFDQTIELYEKNKSSHRNIKEEDDDVEFF